MTYESATASGPVTGCIIDYGGRSPWCQRSDPIRQITAFKGRPSMTEGCLRTDDRAEREERKYKEWVNRAKEKSTGDG
jgi:hypothetical protein